MADDKIDTYCYPQDLNQDDYTRCVSFMALSSLQASDGGKGITNFENILEGKAEKLIILPTPLNLTDTQSHSWSQETNVSAFEKLSQAFGTAASKVASGFAMAGSAPGALLSSLFNAAGSFTSGAFSLATNIGKAPVVGLLSMSAGARKALVNPGYFQNYTNSTPRSFDFQYTFHSRNQDEALTVLNIIRSFKMYSSPTTDTNNTTTIAVKDASAINNGSTNVGTANGNLDNPNDSIVTSGGQPNQDVKTMSYVAGILEKPVESVSKLSDKLAQAFGYMGQPNYWRISFGNKYLDRLIALDYVVCTSVGVTYGNGSKLEMYKDGIPKILSLSLSFSEVKLKMRESFKDPFVKNDANNSDYVSQRNTIAQTTHQENNRKKDAVTAAQHASYGHQQYNYQTWKNI